MAGVRLLTVAQGNFAPWGLLDWIHGTTAGNDLRDDAEDALELQQLKEELRERRRSKLRGRKRD